MFETLPESERKKFFWIALLVLGGLVTALWSATFFKKDVERLQEITFPALPSEEISRQLAPLNEAGRSLRETITLFKGALEDMGSFGDDLTQEEQAVLEAWLLEKEERQEDVTWEELFRFVEELRSTEATTMPTPKISH